jgi:hypothetical protein
MLVGAYEKPAAVTETYVIDWVDRLEGATITNSTWLLPEGTGLEVVAGSPTATASATGMRLRSGTRGMATRVINRVTFSDGRTLDATIDVYVP